MDEKLQIDINTEYGDFVYDGYTNRIKRKDISDSEQDEHCFYTGVYGRGVSERAYERYHCLKAMKLQLTRRCNMRCTYCVYSGDFVQMQEHADESMDISTLFEAVEFFEKHSRESECVRISFYGGESLLEFQKIKETVEYAQDKLVNRKVEFGIASNGLLLKGDVIRYLDEHPNVQVQVTVNGDMHDAFRKTVSGAPSLQQILDNLNEIREFYPYVWENQILLIANIVSYKDIISLKEFYQNKLRKLPELISRISMDGCCNDIKRDFEYNLEEDLEIEAELRKKYIQTNDPFLQKLYATSIQSIHERPVLDENAGMALNPACSPMAHSIFVRTDGKINICERVTDNISFGSVFDGFDDVKIDAYYEAMGHFVERNCMNCWAQHLCMLCFQTVVNEKGEFVEGMSSKWCTLSREYAMRDLKSYIEIMCSNPENLITDN